MPVLLAPIASLTDVDPEGALPVARAAKEFGCLMLVSSVTQPSFEEVARAAGERFALQLYTDGDEKWVVDTAKRAAQAGAKATRFDRRRADVRPPRAPHPSASEHGRQGIRHAAQRRNTSRPR